MPEWSVRRIQRLIDLTGASTYLEIGVQRGLTFLEVKADRCIAVDPAFLFDTSQHSAPGREFHEVPSDDYFRALPRQASFDVVFIDGLHTFEQTYRDLCHAISRTSTDAVYLVDDVWPPDVYGSLETHDDTMRFRKIGTGQSKGGWMGDVYKVTFAVHDFHLTLNYRTILNEGNGQTLMWHASGVTRNPVFNSLETISRLSWFEMRDHAAMMQVSTEEEAFAALCADLGLPYVAGG